MPYRMTSSYPAPTPTQGWKVASGVNEKKSWSPVLSTALPLQLAMPARWHSVAAIPWPVVTRNG